MALPRRAQRLWAYWRAEQRTLRQGLVALALSTLAGFVAGLTLAHITGTLQELPGLIVLIPAAVGMKGTIFGAIGARLGTANVAGLPALSVPFATSSEGLPIGVQLIGRANAEDALLAAAELLRPSDDELRWPAVLRR